MTAASEDGVQTEGDGDWAEDEGGEEGAEEEEEESEEAREARLAEYEAAKAEEDAIEQVFRLPLYRCTAVVDCSPLSLRGPSF